MNAQDFLFDNDNDLLFQDGDLSIGDSDTEHVFDIFYAAPGHFKEFPLVGCNLWADLNGNTPKSKIINKMTVQLKADGYKVNKIDYVWNENDGLVINQLDVEKL